MKFSIVIPSYKHPELIGNLLMDIYQNCTADEVIVVDDFSQDEKTDDTYKFWRRVETFPLKVVHLPENVGFLRASNHGLKMATGDIVALISSDVRIKKDIAKLSMEIVKTPTDKILLGGKVYRESTGWNDFDGRIFPYVEGWALITTKLGWNELGYFDERYVPNDFEDVCLSTTALSKGYELTSFKPWQGDVLEHIGAQSIPYSDERRVITEANRKKFEEKWLRVSP